jgi:cobaltochelatase CobS
MTQHVRLSAEQRTALRRAITSHANWEAYRRENNGMTSADLTSTKCLEIAARFGINVIDVISAAETPIATPKDIEEETAVLAEKTVPVSAAGDAKTAAALAALQSLLSPTVDMATVEKIVTEKVAAALEGTALLRIELKRADGTEYKTSGTQHPLFADLLACLSAAMANKSYINVWIAGPTGSGKTHAAREAAKALGVPFYFNGALGMTHELLGFVDAGGKYHTTPFREAYENGGVYLFDEVDASDNAALLALNAALANGECSFPDKPLPVARHEDFRCIGAANTFGQGATAEFIGRAKIDAAFLSRFPVKLHWAYDIALEQAISGNVEFTKRVQAARARAQAAGVKIVIDPRHSMAGAALIAGGMSSDRAAALTYLSGLSVEQQRIVEGN